MNETSPEPPLRRMPDGTVKQIGPLTGTRVWTVPGGAGRPLGLPHDAPRPLDTRLGCAADLAEAS